MLTTQAQRDASRRWRESHPERAAASYESAKARKKLQYQTDPEFREKVKAANRAAYDRNPQAFIDSHERWRQKPSNRIADALRSKLRRAYSTGLTSSIEELLGCNLEQFRAHIAGQFEAGMTRGNHGSAWEFDHITPCARFDLTDPEQQKACFHYSNLRPLSKLANKSKKDSTVTPQATSGASVDKHESHTMTSRAAARPDPIRNQASIAVTGETQRTEKLLDQGWHSASHPNSKCSSIPAT